MATFQKKADTETTTQTRATLIRQPTTAAKSATAITTAATERTTPAATTSVTAVEDYQHPQARPQRQPLQEQREQSATVVLQLAKSRDSQARRTSNFTHSLHHRQQQHPSHHRPRSRTTAVTHRLGSRRLGAPLLRALYSGAKFNFTPTNSLFRMITMLVVVTVVISGNAVFAVQKDSSKAKDSQSLSYTANAIPNALSGTGIAGNKGNSTNVSNGNTNSDSASSSNGTANTDNDSRASLSSSTGSSSSVTTAEITVITTAITTAVATSSGSNSYSLQKSSAGSSNRGGGGGFPGINRNTIEGLEDVRNGPYFEKAASKNITALLGKTAYLNCRVKNLGNKTMLLQVSWVRHRDIHLLTVGRYTYTSDQRFRAIHQPQTEDWILQIKYPQHRDSGVYECQVSTTPHMSHYIHLNVVEPSTEIIGAPDLYIESGSTINLTCVILNSPEPPAYIFWNHNNAIINYDSPRGGVSVVTNKGETTTSFLLIKSARPSDSGHYQCNPSNAKHKSVTVHVLNGEFPAAMQHAARAHLQISPGRYLLVCLSIYCCSSAYVRRFMPLPVAV